MRILHIVKDWWLSEWAIAMFNSLPVENEYVFFNPSPGNKYEFKVLKSTQYVKIVDVDSLEYNTLLSDGKFDLLWAHGLYPATATFVSKLNSDVKVMWSSYGFDYLLYGAQWLYGPSTTLVWVKSTPISIVIKDLIRWFIYKLGMTHLVFGGLLNQLYFKFFDRVDYFSCVVPTEEKMIRKLIGKRAKKILFNCISPDAKDPDCPVVDLNVKRMLVGNSAYMTNNHFDIFPVIAKSNWDVYSPLSYTMNGVGESKYSDKVVCLGRELMGARFHPLLEFMPKDEYLKIMAKCSVFIFNIYRQQALWNIRMALTVGGCVFMCPNNPAYRYFTSHGIIIYPIKRLKSGIPEVIKEFKPYQLENIRKIKALRNCERMIEEVRNSVGVLSEELDKGKQKWHLRNNSNPCHVQQ